LHGLPAGLRILIVPQEVRKKRKEAERKREYRQKIKEDPEKHERQREYKKKKCKEYRNCSLTEEELQARRDSNRLRVQLFEVTGPCMMQVDIVQLTMVKVCPSQNVTTVT